MWVRIFGACVWISTSLLACSEKDPDTGEGGSGGVSVGGASGAETGGAAAGGAAGSFGQASGGGGGTAGGAAATGGGGATGRGGAATGGKASTPDRKNCGEVTCDEGLFCLSLTRPYSAVENSNECATPPDGCSARSMCDCRIQDWKGAEITGCIAAGSVSTLFVTDYSCGDAPCGSDEICLIPSDDATPASCVAPPDGCPVDASFCRGDCDEQAAKAAGLELVGCRHGFDGGVAVTVR